MPPINITSLSLITTSYWVSLKLDLVKSPKRLIYLQFNVFTENYNFHREHWEILRLLCNPSFLNFINFDFFSCILFSPGDRVGTVVKVLCFKSESRWFDSRYHSNFSLTFSFRSHYGPGFDSASNIKWVPGEFSRGKCGRCVRLTT
jgi:hypothetical protein